MKIRIVLALLAFIAGFALAMATLPSIHPSCTDLFSAAC